jgi:hypothetical protein
MRYTHYRGLAQVSNWVRLKFAAMNLKKLARWKTTKRFAPASSTAYSYILSLINFVACLVMKPDRPFFDRLRRSPFGGAPSSLSKKSASWQTFSCKDDKIGSKR